MFGPFGKGDNKTGDRWKILKMLEAGKISVDEAERLLNAIGSETSTATSKAVEPIKGVVQSKARYLRVVVSEGGSEKVDVRVPLQLIRAGIKLGSVIPQDVQGQINAQFQEHGMQFSLSDIKPEMIEDLIDGLTDLSVNVNDGGDGVRVFCE